MKTHTYLLMPLLMLLTCCAGCNDNSETTNPQETIVNNFSETKYGYGILTSPIKKTTTGQTLYAVDMGRGKIVACWAHENQDLNEGATVAIYQIKHQNFEAVGIGTSTVYFIKYMEPHQSSEPDIEKTEPPAE